MKSSIFSLISRVYLRKQKPNQYRAGRLKEPFAKNYPFFGLIKGTAKPQSIIAWFK